MSHPAGGAAVGEGHYALRLRETKRVRVRASVVFVVASLAVVTVSTSGAVPDCVGGVELFAKAATVGKWEGSSRTTSWHLFVVVLGHGVPPKAVIASVLNGRG